MTGTVTEMLATINFGIGMPNPELLPVELLREAAQKGISSNYLNYTAAQGNPAVQENLADFLQATSSSPVAPGDLLITGGSLQIINHICANLTRPGDIVFVEEPTFYLMLTLFKDHGLQIVPIPVDDDGIDLNVLEDQLKHMSPKLVYTIPAFHNPTGVTLSRERKDRLVELSQKHNFLIVADEVYRLLYYTGEPPASFADYLASDHVLVVGSFSKILAPGLRLGWLHTSPLLMSQMVSKGLVAISGGFNHFASGIVAQLLQSGQQQVILEKIRQTFTRRVTVLDGALRDHLPANVHFRKPAGGYFFWLELPEQLNALQLREQAQTFGVNFQPGSFFGSRVELQNFIRISFGYYEEQDLIAGAGRLGRLLKQST